MIENILSSRDKVIKRFKSKISIDKNSRCWIWIGTTSRGYGKFKLNRRLEYAHRVSIELFKGIIPGNLQVLHKCGVRSCVNPDHLYIGTHGDNMEDGIRAGVYGKLSWKEVNEIRKLVRPRIIRKEDTASRKEASIKYGVAQSTINKIVSDKTWLTKFRPEVK